MLKYLTKKQIIKMTISQKQKSIIIVIIIIRNYYFYTFLNFATLDIWYKTYFNIFKLIELLITDSSHLGDGQWSRAQWAWKLWSFIYIQS